MHYFVFNEIHIYLPFPLASILPRWAQAKVSFIHEKVVPQINKVLKNTFFEQEN